jgi:protein KTI12
MPALILCGKPCVGKTAFCNLLKERAEVLMTKSAQEGHENGNTNKRESSKPLERVQIVSETLACPDKTKRERYQDSHAEKVTRGALKADFDRCSNRQNTLILLDSSNYIKGYRYELHCISKAASDKHGIVWVQNEDCASKEWNAERHSEGESADEAFTDEMMEALNYRFEAPNEKNRWDKPLFAVDMMQCKNKEALRQRADEILDSFLCHTESLQRGMSTAKALPTKSNVLHDVDKITQRICSTIQEAQHSMPAGSGRISVPVQHTSIAVNLSRTIHLPKLRRLGREFVKWISDHPPQDCTEYGIASSFCKYLEQNI